MGLQIRTTGIEDFLDGSHNIKMLVVGGPGVGKTRMSSFWPKPIYADCESGRASIADRNVAYASVRGSKDMLDFLAYLKGLERTPKAERQFQTVVVDTLDGFQRSVKDEWLQKTNSGEFKGYDAWGYLDTKMNMLMTRLLNLDYNVIVLVHYDVKAGQEGEAATVQLQLDGKIKTTAFNDFDLVGKLGTFWAAEDGQRVEKRGLTFKATQDWPFLKDRLAVTPDWIEVTFSESDYSQLFEALNERLGGDGFASAAVVGDIPDADDEKSPNVVPPMSGGPVQRQAKPEAAAPKSLAEMSKEQLIVKARELGYDPKGNTLKAELITMIESGPRPAEQTVDEAPVLVVEETPVQVEAAPEPEPTAEPDPVAKPASDSKDNCADCGKSLADQTPDYTKLSFIKYRRYLCDDCYAAAKTAQISNNK